MLDLDFVRARFPALRTPWALMDNAGGSVPCRQAIRRLQAFLEETPVQLGATHGLSVQAAEVVAAGRRAAATLLGADPDEIVLGPSSTVAIDLLARALRPTWTEGDEVIVTNLDHETNVGPWRALADTGIALKEWTFRPETVSLELEDLEPLLGPRTRLVAFTHCSNVVGTIHDVARIARRIRAAGALSCVDGVAYAPHRRVDVGALGVDFYFASLYKVYGTHVSALFGRRELLREARGQNHFFVGEERVPTKLEPGNPSYESAASIVGILDYFEDLSRQHFGATEPFDLGRCFELVLQHECELARPLLDFLDRHPGVRLIGRADPDPEQRVPTIAFVVAGRQSSEIPPQLDQRRLATRYGHFYAYRPIRELGLLERDGVVRVSLVHYNSHDEVARLIDALDEIL